MQFIGTLFIMRVNSTIAVGQLCRRAGAHMRFVQGYAVNIECDANPMHRQ
eukprot:m.1658364 g.1658364  ORF g.1658364 m.1658364 type:complete len:50 (-) comp116293_c0_seq1:123-272(-)